jgi:antitoxin (DNA-binding transcriptional repressor) of toxin-antitoxin stability system
MKTVSARQANHEFSDLLSRVERGEEILITQTEQAGRGLKCLSSTANDRGAQKGHSTRDRCDVEGPVLGRHLTKVQPRRDTSAVMIISDTNVLVYATAFDI